MFDLAPQHLASLLALLEQYVPDSEVWVYGSRVDGRSHSASDIDLVVRNPADLTQTQPNLWELKNALAESNLPILVDVMDWARVPDYFKQEMQQSHVVLRNSSVPYSG
jgi:predicted nucleotidyltransferase